MGILPCKDVSMGSFMRTYNGKITPLFPFPPHFLKQTQHKGLYLTISFKISSNKSFPLFCCLHTIRVVFRLNKTLFTHFDYNYVRIECLLMTQNRKLLISSSKMRDYIGKKCEQSLYLNPKLSP